MTLLLGVGQGKRKVTQIWGRIPTSPSLLLLDSIRDVVTSGLRGPWGRPGLAEVPGRGDAMGFGQAARGVGWELGGDLE